MSKNQSKRDATASRMRLWDLYFFELNSLTMSLYAFSSLALDHSTLPCAQDTLHSKSVPPIPFHTTCEHFPMLPHHVYSLAAWSWCIAFWSRVSFCIVFIRIPHHYHVLYAHITSASSPSISGLVITIIPLALLTSHFMLPTMSLTGDSQYLKSIPDRYEIKIACWLFPHISNITGTFLLAVNNSELEYYYCTPTLPFIHSNIVHHKTRKTMSWNDGILWLTVAYSEHESFGNMVRLQSENAPQDGTPTL